MTNQSNQMVVMQKDITDQVSNRISQLQDDGLALPKDYNPQNALKAAWFKLQQTKDRSNRPALHTVINCQCTARYGDTRA